MAFFVVFTFSLVLVPIAAHTSALPFCDAISDCHAIADNETNVADVLSACATRCSTIFFPANKSFLISSIDVSNTSNLTFLFGDGAGLFASSNPSDYPITPFFPPMGTTQCWRAVIYGRNVTSFTITGPRSAVIDGLGWPWWANYSAGTLKYQRPKLIELVDADGLDFVGMTFRNSPQWTFHPIFSRNIRFINISVLAPRPVGNTDGIDPDSCENVLIDNCHIDVGDDAISIKSGWHDITGKLMPSANITVQNSLILSRNVAIGSACFGGIRDVLITNSTIGDEAGSSPWAFKIKSHLPRGGVVERISLISLRIGRIAPNTYQQPGAGMVISIYQNYGTTDVHDTSMDFAARQEAHALASGWSKPEPAPPTLITDVLFRNITAIGCKWAANPIAGSSVSAISALTFDNVDFGQVTEKLPWLCSNVTGTHVTGRVYPALPDSCL